MVSKTGNPDSLGGANSEEIDVKNSHRKFGLICLVSLAGTMVTQLQGPFQKEHILRMTVRKGWNILLALIGRASRSGESRQ
jgi:hypothetical protein